MTTSLSERKTVSAKPFLKWAGGKTQLVPNILSLINSQISQNCQFNYIEPFVGGGAVLFSVLNNFSPVQKVIINDINPDLIMAYNVIKNNVKELIVKLKKIQQDFYELKNLEEQQKFFLDKRIEFNSRSCDDCLEKTVLLLFLNRTCFNGLYRVNSKGLFNVPFGKYVKPLICNEENLLAVNHHLQKVTILQGDFVQTLNYANNKTLFYFDPPYKPIKKTSAFTSYTKEDFNDEEQIRLKQFIDQVDRAGYKFILSNSDLKNFDSDNNFFDDLYKNYNIQRVKARRNINSQGNNRGEIWELLINN
ncbi:DNA adenine methylase [Microcystis ichthyoblabe FBCC-A1114]|uniref:DNA adenine methylase n=1 Tax=Microcystis TaxID=1125 RepID=UPI003D2A5DB5